jgi:hypothetical protein
MVERTTSHRPEKPIAQSTQIQQHPPHVERMPEGLKTTIQHISDFVTHGKGRSYLRAGKPPEYSKKPTGDSKRVYRFASNFIVDHKKAGK